MAISEQTFFLDPAHQGSLQQQVRQMVASGILSGRFRAGERLPSSRRLAAHLGVSRITVTLAYNDLMADDYLTSAGRSGYFVSANAPAPPVATPLIDRQDRVNWAAAMPRRFSGGRHVDKPPDWRRYRYPFLYGQADPSLFDHQNWRLCALKALGQRDYDSLTTDQMDRDDPLLVEFIARQTLPRRGILARPEEILITVGAQNALWLAAQVLLAPGRIAAIEEPCYPGLRDILRQSGCTTRALPVDEDGLNPALIPPDVDVIFTTPSHQCPTAATMPLARRHVLLDRAAAGNALIVEDDYEFEMSFLTAPSPALKSLDRDGRVVHVGSFSKVLFPGLRLGYLVGAEPFITEARALRSAVLRHLPGHIQRTAAYFLSLGHYDAMIRRLRAAFADRRRVMERALRHHGLTIAGRGAFGGSSFWMQCSDGIDPDLLAQRLKARDVLIEPGTPFFDQPFGDQPFGDQPFGYQPGPGFYRLAYSSIPADRIGPGVALIADEIRLMAAGVYSVKSPAV